MMKKVLCMLVGLLLSGMAVLQAQTEGGQLILRGGFATNNFKGAHTRADILPSYDFSLSYARLFYRHVYWTTGAMFTTRGFDREHGGKLRTHAFGVPLAVGYHYNVTSRLAVDFRLGGFFTVDMAGKFKPLRGDDIGIGDIDDFRRCDGGVLLGFGLWYKCVSLDYSYRRGFGKLWPDGPKNAVTHAIRLGYAF